MGLMSDLSFLKRFFQALADEPLAVGDDRYVKLYDEPILKPYDPVGRLARAVEFSEGRCGSRVSRTRTGPGSTTPRICHGFRASWIPMRCFLIAMDTTGTMCTLSFVMSSWPRWRSSRGARARHEWSGHPLRGR